MKLKVILNVDEAKLKASVTDGMEPEEAREATACSLEAMVHNELGWVASSGITVDSMEELKEAGNADTR